MCGDLQCLVAVPQASLGQGDDKTSGQEEVFHLGSVDKWAVLRNTGPSDGQAAVTCPRTALGCSHPRNPRSKAAVPFSCLLGSLTASGTQFLQERMVLQKGTKRRMKRQREERSCVLLVREPGTGFRTMSG